MANRSTASLHRVSMAFMSQLHAMLDAVALPRTVAGRVLFMATETLQSLAAPTVASPDSLSDQLFQREAWARRTEAGVAEIMGEEPTGVLLEQGNQVADDLSAAWNRGENPLTVGTPYGPSRLIDYLRANLIELVAMAYHAGLEPLPATIAEATRSLCTVLGERFPGKTIEMRVPPLAAVQLGSLNDGSIHTRGTPPNVIETDPQCFLALARGATSWAQAKASGRVRSSGAHADEVAQMLPLAQFENH